MEMKICLLEMTTEKDGETITLVDSVADLIEIDDILALWQTGTMH